MHGWQGGGLDGANSDRFLKKIADLRKVAPPITYPILNTLQKFQYITTGCFGWELCSDYKKRIQDFQTGLVGLQKYCRRVFRINFTIAWKLHMICCHLEPLLTKLGTGLAVYCEQAGEAVHHKMKNIKARFKRNIYHINHGRAQMGSVVNWLR